MLKRKYWASCFSSRLGKSDYISIHILLSLFLLLGATSLEVASLGNEPQNPAKVDTTPNNENVSEYKSKTPIDFLTSSDQRKRMSDRETASDSLVTILGALALVLCAFLGLVYITKNILPRRRRILSSSVEIIDLCFLDSKSELMTILWGGKLILLAKSHGCFSTLSELSDKEEINKFLTNSATVKKKVDSTAITRWFKYFSSENKERNIGEE